MFSDHLRRDVIPTLDVGSVKLLERRELEVVPGVRAFDETTVLLTDGSRVTADVVISATGYRRDLEPLVGHLGVLGPHGRPTAHGARTHPAAPGLYFIGFTSPISGNLRELGFQARKIAKALIAMR